MAYLGLMVVVYGLVLAPVLHATVEHSGGLELPEAAQEWVGHPGSTRAHGAASEHEASGPEDSGHTHSVAGHGHEHGPGHGHSHRHGKGQPHRHAWGAVEHLQAVALSPLVLLLPGLAWELLRVVAVQRHQWVPVAPLRLTAMPQGP